MFGFVTANTRELNDIQRRRYRAVYCGICHRIGENASRCSRLCLSYDLVFLALVLSSLYEPEEQENSGRCVPHPFSRQDYLDSEIIAYAADMNVALGYYSAQDHWQDDRRLDALTLARLLREHYGEVRNRHPRQCEAIERELETLRRLEKEGCPNPDLPANAFGRLLGELFVWREDHWSTCLRELGRSLGRFIYLADAAMDYHKDRKKGSYNPFLASGSEPDREKWNTCLTMEMAGCARAYEHLPLVQDKDIMDNILYSGVWLTYRHKEKKGQRRTQDADR